jgi:Holliday junction DNA helicase RuvA
MDKVRIFILNKLCYMISYLTGKIIHKGLNHIIVNVGGVGYGIFLSEQLAREMKVGDEAEIYTHQYVREDALDLYGFKNSSDLELFEMLISVSGIGPKSALAVLSLATSEDVISSIVRGDSQLLTKVSGIGQKTAERIVLELKSKVVKLGGNGDSSLMMTGGDEMDALMALGYTLSQSREVLRSVSPDITDSGERVKEALKKMRK